MRTKTKRKPVQVDVDVHKKLTKDREEFQGLIGGGTWSLSDVIREYQKILETIK